MHSRTSRRTLLRGALGVAGTLGIAPLLAACQSSAAPAGKPAETKPAETKPAESKPAAPAAQPAATKPAEAKPAAQAPAVSKKLGGELRLHLRVGPEEDTMKEVLPKFTQDTGVQVKIESFPTNEYFTKMQTLIAGGTAGDVWWGLYRNTPRYAHNKIIMQLDDLVKADNFDLSQYWPAAIDAARYQGGLWAMPFKLHPGPSALYYNVKAAQEAGLTMPEKQFASWDDLIRAAKAMTKESGGRTERYGFQLNLTPGSTSTTPQVITMYARSFGADIYSEDGKKSLLNEPKVKEAIAFIYNLMHTEKVTVTGRDFTEQAEELMIAERTAMLQASSSTKSIPTKIGGKFEVKNMLMPPGPAGVVGTQAITDHININAQTQNKEGAWELTKLLCGKEVGVRLGGGTGGIASGTTGGRIDVFNDPQIMANPLHPIFIDLVKNATAPRLPANLREEESSTAMHQTLAPIWLGERKPDDAFFGELNTAVQGVLDRPMA